MPVLPSGRNSELELENQAKTMPLLPSGQISRILSPHPQSGRIFGKSVRTKMADFGFFVIRVLQVYSGVLSLRARARADDSELRQDKSMLRYVACITLGRVLNLTLGAQLQFVLGPLRHRDSELSKFLSLTEHEKLILWAYHPFASI